MSRTSLGLIATLLLAGGAALAYQLRPDDPPLPPRTGAERPLLALLTSLPVVFGEHFVVEGGGSPALGRLEQRYRVLPVSLADAASLKGHRLLLMAHARAQPAEVLVELDAWVRAGGRVVLLADPRLKWESSRPLGDPLRPPPDFADTGLLGHWGLVLSADDGEGVLRVTGEQCSLAEGSLVARCAIGRGQAVVIADADFIMLGDGGPAIARFDMMMREMARLESR